MLSFWNWVRPWSWGICQDATTACAVDLRAFERCVQETYEEGYGTVLDSGTTFTYLPTEAFKAFRDAVTSFAIGKGLKLTKGPDPKFYDICFGGAPHVEHADQLEHVFPHLDLQFKAVNALPLLSAHPDWKICIHACLDWNRLRIWDSMHRETFLPSWRCLQPTISYSSGRVCTSIINLKPNFALHGVHWLEFVHITIQSSTIKRCSILACQSLHVAPGWPDVLLNMAHTILLDSENPYLPLLPRKVNIDLPAAGSKSKNGPIELPIHAHSWGRGLLLRGVW